jgi:hypothetical protein
VLDAPIALGGRQLTWGSTLVVAAVAFGVVTLMCLIGESPWVSFRRDRPVVAVAWGAAAAAVVMILSRVV